MKLKLLTFLLIISASAFGQKDGFGVHFGGYDFYGPETGQYLFVRQDKVKYAADNMKNDTVTRHRILWQPLVKVSYWHKISPWIDLSVGLSLADIEYPASKKDSNFIYRQLDDYGNRTDHFLGELDARINYNILAREKHMFTPYIFAGLTMSYHSIFMGADFPFGAGLNVHLRTDRNIYLNLEAGYKAALTSNDFNHLQYTVGIIYWFKSGYRVKAKETEPTTDTEPITEPVPTPPAEPTTIPPAPPPITPPAPPTPPAVPEPPTPPTTPAK